MFHESVDHNLIVIDYLACDSILVVHGVLFGKILDQLKMVAHASGIGSVVFEVEDPGAITNGKHLLRAKARIRKFQSHDARVIDGLRYLAPDMDNFGVGGAEDPFFLMHSAIGAYSVRRLTRGNRVDMLTDWPSTISIAARIAGSDEISVQPSAIHGRGLYPRHTFAKGERIYKIRGRQVFADYDANFSEGPNWIGLGWREWLIPEPANPIIFTNHACCPNAIISDGLTVIALRDIEIGDEIVVDYSTTEVDPFWRMLCSCQSATCRKQIRAFSHFPVVVQRFYGRLLPRKFREAAREVYEVHRPIIRSRIRPVTTDQSARPTKYSMPTRAIAPTTTQTSAEIVSPSTATFS
jgi:hypothetical protein